MSTYDNLTPGMELTEQAFNNRIKDLEHERDVEHRITFEDCRVGKFYFVRKIIHGCGDPKCHFPKYEYPAAI